MVRPINFFELCLSAFSVLLLLASCSDDRPVGDTLKPAKDIDDLIKDIYDPRKREYAAARMNSFKRFVVPKLSAEVADNSKSTPDEIEARVVILEMLARLDDRPEIDGLLIMIARDGKFPARLKEAAAEAAKDRDFRRVGSSGG